TAEIRALLTGPGGMFEVVTEEVNGRSLQVYKNRLGSLREVATAAQGRGDAEDFIVHGERRIGFASFVALANSISRTLRDEFGVGHGDRVAVLSQNNPEWCLAFWATVDVGAILVGLNGWWKADEILYGLQDSGAKILVADAKRFERIAGDLDQAPDLEHVFLIDRDPVGHDPRLHHFDELTTSPSPEPPDIPIAEEDPAVIFYTSGTTGRPKGAISTHRNMIANLQNTLYSAAAGAMRGSSVLPSGGGQNVSLLTSPLFHVSGCHSSLVVGMLAGVRIVIPDGKFEPEKALELLERERVTVWATVPTMIWRVCEYPKRHDYDTSTVTSVAFGGSPSAEELQRKIRETFPNVRTTSNAYGLTESSSVATVISGEDAVAKPTSVGPPVPTVEVRIVEPTGEEVAGGETGEVLIRGPIIMPGYWNKPDDTAKAVDDDGWLHTGDIGYVDADGFLYITDRAKDMIIRGGENIYCVEIENRLVEHPGVADAAVVGAPHPALGEEVKAVIQLEPGETVSADDLRTWVRTTLADFKVPTHVEMTYDPLPRNASGKLLKNVLRGEGDVGFEELM
ncbi:MAG: class I adenylate-forming enzyme family protein, partial [Acidimicrobiales bacterium]